jgi:uncharacterized protein YecE (DUF72 family)
MCRSASWKFEYYVQHFDTVELNNSFYRLPDKGVFAVKASRFLTHMKKLKDPREPVRRLFSRARELRTKLGPVLYQLPRQMPKNLERLEAFLAVLPRAVKHTIEFRNPSWYDEEVFRALREVFGRIRERRSWRLGRLAGRESTAGVRLFQQRCRRTCAARCEAVARVAYRLGRT